MKSGDHFAEVPDEGAEERGGILAFLLGGAVIAGGLLGFLYLDSDHQGANVTSPSMSSGRLELSIPDRTRSPS